MDEHSLQLAIALRDILQQHNARIVLAESCTAGRVSATLGSLPGISNWLCGSFVVYRCDSKTRWLGIPATMLDDPHIGPVSQPTTDRLAQAALAVTPEAQFGIAVTGDVGPDAPHATDGLVFCALCEREGPVRQQARYLTSPAPGSSQDITARVARLREATQFVLDFAIRSMLTRGQ